MAVLKTLIYPIQEVKQLLNPTLEINQALHHKTLEVLNKINKFPLLQQ
jgi:hypothetical protein